MKLSYPKWIYHATVEPKGRVIASPADHPDPNDDGWVESPAQFGRQREVGTLDAADVTTQVLSINGDVSTEEPTLTSQTDRSVGKKSKNR